jgi:hypothetical protein
VPIKVLDAQASDAVFAFLDQTMVVRGQQGRGREHWRWKYRLRAARPPSAFYWQESDGRVIGFIGLMRTTLRDSSTTGLHGSWTGMLRQVKVASAWV